MALTKRCHGKGGSESITGIRLFYHHTAETHHTAYVLVHERQGLAVLLAGTLCAARHGGQASTGPG